MRYEFLCETCGEIHEYFNPIAVGPPTKVLCSQCRTEMHHEIGGNFILKGEWPGKSINKDYAFGQTADGAQTFLDEHDSKKKESKEVLKERRKGKKSFQEYTKRNKPKVERYYSNLKNGIRPKDD